MNKPTTGFDASPLFPNTPWWTRERLFLFFGLLALCCVTRLYDLGRKPIMHDEALFVFYTEFQFVRSFTYEYLPILHGPLLLWITAGIFQVFGTSDYTMRLAAALFGIGGFFWIWTLRGWIGQRGTWFALAFYTVSPGLMFYQRFFRNDDLFFFLTLWIVAAMAWWWRTKSPWWAASFLIANVLLFCNKASSVFIYFTLFTFLLFVLVHDLARGLIDGHRKPLAVVSKVPRPVWLALIYFSIPVAMLVFVLEGIRYEDSVVAAVGRDFPLRDVRSIPMALGWHPEVPDVGRAGLASTWRLFYAGLIVGSIGLAWLTHALVDRQWGRNAIAARCWESLWSGRWIIIGAAGLGLFLYLFIYTTAFKYPMGPFEIYHETLAYWGGQHAQHRIKGPFHMHLVTLVVYEFALVILMLAAWIVLAWKAQWQRGSGLGIVLAAVAFAGFHGAFFGGTGIGYFKYLAAITLVIGLLLTFLPSIGRWGSMASLLVFWIFSYRYFQSAAWSEFFFNSVTRDGVIVAWSGRELLDDRIGMTSGMHLFLVAQLILVAAHLSWMALEKGRRFEAFSLWWLITITGASCYAKEKVPWVGVHISIPLAILGGIYAERIWQWGRSFPGLRQWIWRTVYGFLIVGTVWHFRAAHMASFQHPGDVRERLAYGETVVDLRNHADRIVAYAGISDVRRGSDGEFGGWRSNYNEPTRLRDLRIVVDNEATVWPLRWYFRDLDWSFTTSASAGVESRAHFVFMTPRDANAISGIEEHYRLYRARARMHYTPRMIDWGAMTSLWRSAIPFHNRPQNDRDLERARAEWRAAWRYFAFREVFPNSEMELPTVEYVLAVRKDVDW